MRFLVACSLALVITTQQLPPTRPPSTPPGTQPAPPSQRGGRLPRERSATGEALDRYIAGQYEDAIAKLSLLGGFNSRQAQEWTLASGPQAAPRRRLAAATMALEYTASRPGLSPQLIEWARDLTRGGPPEWEPVWLRASIALAEGSEAWMFLAPAAAPAAAPGAARPRAAAAPAPGYLAEARVRFPDDPYVRLAQAVGLEFEASAPAQSPLSRRANGPVALDHIASEMLDATAGESARAAVQRAVAAFEALVADEHIGAEARLRAGYCRLRLGEPDRARDHFRQAASSADPFVKYLAHLYDGWSLAREGQADAAAAAYREALRVVPYARSATLLLTSVLFTHHRLADAEAVATGFMSLPINSAGDPRRSYRLGDYRSYRDLIARLRGAIQ